MQRVAPRKIIGPSTMVRAALRGVVRRRFSPRVAVADLAGLAARERHYRRALRRER
jgi:hypothetical protein